MQGCCADSTIRAADAIWAETVTGNASQARVNLAFNRATPLVDVTSCLPHRGEINVIVKAAERVVVRVPQWAPKERVKAYVDKKPTAVAWDGSYVVFPGVTRGQQLTVIYPLRLAEVQERVMASQFTERWRGNTIVAISPPGEWIPMYQRPELETEVVPR